MANYATISNAENIDASDMTFSFRLKASPFAANGNKVILFNRNASDINSSFWRMFIKTNSDSSLAYIFFSYTKDSSHYFERTHPFLPIVDNLWHEIEIRGQNLQTDNPTIDIWVDKTLQPISLIEGEGPLRASSSDITIFGASDIDYAIDELMIWKSALSDEQIAVLQAATTDPTVGLNPDYHWTFNEDDSGYIYPDTGNGDNGKDATCNVTTHQAHTTGVFSNAFNGYTHTETFTLDYTAAANGSVQLSENAHQVVDYGGDGVLVTATPDAHYHFSAWSDDANIPAARQDTNITANVDVTAYFLIDSYLIDVSAGPNGSIDPSGKISVNYSDNSPLFKATSDEGYTVDHWELDGDVVQGEGGPLTEDTYTVPVVHDNHTLEVFFKSLNTKVTLDVSTSLGGFVSEPGIGSFEYNNPTDVPLVAEADPDYNFLFWSGTGLSQIVNPLLLSTSITVNADYTVRANFEKKEDIFRSPPMIKKIDPRRDVPITVLMAQTARALDMTLLALLVPSASFLDSERVKYYHSMDEFAVDYDSTTTQYWAGKAFFDQIPHPEKMAVGLIATADMPGKLISGILTAAEIETLESVSAGTFKLHIAGSEVSITGVNFTAAETLADICTAIAAASGFPTGGTCAENADGSFTISTGSGHVGDTEIMDYATAGASADLSASLKLTEATGAQLSQGHSFGTLIEEAEIVRQVSINNGYPIFGWCLDTSYRTSSALADIEAFADWVLTLKLGYASLCSNVAGSYTADETGSLAYYVNTETANHKVHVTFSDNDQQYPDVSILARMLAVDYSGVATTISAKGKDLVGCTPVSLTESQLDILIGKRANCMTLMSNDLRIYREGMTGNPNWWIDDSINIDNLTNELETALCNVVARNGKIPNTPAGQAMRRSAAIGILQKYVINGTSAPRPVTDLTSESGFTVKPAFTITQGGVETATAAMRAARQDVVMQIEVYLANAIHYGAVTINVIQ